MNLTLLIKILMAIIVVCLGLYAIGNSGRHRYSPGWDRVCEFSHDFGIYAGTFLVIVLLERIA